MALDRNRSRETGRVNFRTDFWGQGNYCSIADGCVPSNDLKLRDTFRLLLVSKGGN